MNELRVILDESKMSQDDLAAAKAVSQEEMVESGTNIRKFFMEGNFSDTMSLAVDYGIIIGADDNAVRGTVHSYRAVVTGMWEDEAGDLWLSLGTGTVVNLDEMLRRTLEFRAGL